MRELDDAGLSLVVLETVERAKQDRDAAVLMLRLCAALQWSTDSIERILAGGEPVDGGDPSPPTPPGFVDVPGLSGDVVEQIAQQVEEPR